MKALPFRGSGVAIVTPFTDNHEIDYDSLAELIEMHIAHKTDAIVICGTTGEASAMPDDEHLAAIAFTVKQVNKRVPVIAGTGSNDTYHAINLSKRAAQLGADALLSVTPYYNKANKSGLINHFKAIAEVVDIPIILYNVPSRTGVNFSIDVLKELAKIDNIVGLKEASGNISYVAQVAAEVPELHLYSGNDDMIVPIMSLGGVGVISVVANIFPDETHDICELFDNGDLEGSRKLQLEMLDLINKLFIEVNPVPVKSAMKELGYQVGDLRLPLGEMDSKNLKTLMDALEKFGAKKLI
ncbi:MAG: 4-hydroxy-tetrahydrodipicolinate synthase [Clostridia bacterium]|nr:4-hydroxy-tetrahydrodipicolinate synthase [Clostridia bacterium]